MDRLERGLDEAALRVLVGHSPDGIMVVGSDGDVLLANPAAEAIFGRGGSVVGQSFGIPLVAADKTEIDVRGDDGTVAVYELRVATTPWADGEAQLVTLRDVTERVHNEARIVELNNELQLRADAANVLSHVGDGVILLDEAGTVLLWNAAAERILGVMSEWALGRHITKSVPGWEEIAGTVTHTTAPFDDEAPQGQSIVVDIDGTERWLSFTAVRFSSGSVYAFHDVTQEARLEAMKKDFIDTASHELRTPLTSIHGAARTLQRLDLDLDSETTAQLLEVITTQTERLRKITEDILVARRIDDRSSPVEHVAFDVAHAAAEVLGSMPPEDRAGISFELDDQLDGTRELASDRDKVHQVLSNLVQNAVKYSPEGGTVRVTVAYSDNSGTFRYDVRDDGIGIASSEIESIFDKFYRSPAHVEANNSIPGTGLGLYIARELVRRLGGRLTVRSREGVGSTFSVELPASNGRG